MNKFCCIGKSGYLLAKVASVQAWQAAPDRGAALIAECGTATCLYMRRPITSALKPHHRLSAGCSK